MNLPINDLVSIANLWVLNLQNKNILKKEWEVKIINKQQKIKYKSNNKISNIKLEALLEQHMLAYIHNLYLKHKT